MTIKSNKVRADGALSCFAIQTLGCLGHDRPEDTVTTPTIANRRTQFPDWSIEICRTDPLPRPPMDFCRTNPIPEGSSEYCQTNPSQRPPMDFRRTNPIPKGPSEYCQTNPISRLPMDFCRTNPTRWTGVERGAGSADRFLSRSNISDRHVFAKRSQCSSKPKTLMNLRAIATLGFRPEIVKRPCDTVVRSQPQHSRLTGPIPSSWRHLKSRERTQRNRIGRRGD